MTINSAKILLELDATVQNTAGTQNNFYRAILQYAQGVGDGQIDQSYGAIRTIAASGTPDLVDLAGGNVYGEGGAVLTFARVKDIVVFNTSTAQTLTVGGSGHTLTTMLSGTTPGIIIPPAYTANGVTYPSFVWLHCPTATGYAVTAGTGDVLRVATGGGTNVPYVLFLNGGAT